MRMLQIGTVIGTLLFGSALPASATAPIPDAKNTTQVSQSSGTKSASKAPRPASGSRAIANPKLMGKLDLSKLPKGPDGQRFVATVNGVPIPEKLFLAALKEAAGTPDVPGASARQAALAEPVLQRLLLTSLYEEFARKNSLRISDAEVQHEFKVRNAALPAGRKLQDTAALSGLTNDDQLDNIRRDLLQRRVEQYMGDKFTSGTPTSKEIADFVQRSGVAVSTGTEELRVRHIVIRATPEMSAEALKNASDRTSQVLEQIQSGMEFPEAARSYSQDRFTVARGGDLGYLTKGSMFPEFEQAAFALKPGEVSGVVRTSVGYHIIQVTERHAGNARSLYIGEQRERGLSEWRDGLLKSAKVENFLQAR